MFKGRILKTGGHSYAWRLSAAKGRYLGTSAKTASFTAQSAEAHGALLRVALVSKKWTPEMDWDDDRTIGHKVSFTPKDAEKAIEEARKAGWDPTKKGAEFKLPAGIEFEDYRS